MYLPQAQACGFLFALKIDLLTSTISFIKRLVAIFVDANKIALRKQIMKFFKLTVEKITVFLIFSPNI